jgi:tellurite resistance protein TehA-like permease
MSARLARSLTRIPPGSWTVVMGCGIVSIDLLSIGQRLASAILLWFAVAVWLVLVLRLLSSADRLRTEPRSVAILGSVAGTAVLGARFAAQGDNLVPATLLGLAATSFAFLAVPVLRHWIRPATGTSFVLSVALQGIAVLAATVAASYHARWLLAFAGLASLAGLVSYAVIARQFNLHEIAAGVGDQWVAGGALAISTLALGKITASAAVLGVGGLGVGGLGVGGLGVATATHDELVDVTLALWCLAMAWLVVLIIAELARPRLGYDVRRWATVFPVGMYAACAFSTGQLTGITAITDFARIWTLVAAAVTLVVLAGLLRRARFRDHAPHDDHGNEQRDPPVELP